jgi:hypothetical protein
MSKFDVTPFLAYEKEHHAIESIMRLQAVKRWHMIETTRTQTLAEHSANVALLAMLIAATSPLESFSNPYSVAAMALMHDMPEAFTGDIPSHTKRHLTGIDRLEEGVMPSELVLITPAATANDRMLLKMCDIADGIRFIRTHGVDATAVHAQEGLEAQLRERAYHAENGLKWSDTLRGHVSTKVMFYAYEGN